MNIEALLNQACIMKWKDSDTCKELRNSLLKDARRIKLDTAELYVSACLFTNDQLLQILNSLPRINLKTDTYLILNEHNPSLPVYFDPAKESYGVKSGYEDHPAVGISWDGAALVSYLLGGRLLYEKEWEICATSGNPDYVYPWGNADPSIEKANYGEHVGETTPVKSYPPNEWGFYDMAGNVEEWCMDYFHPEYRYLGLTRVAGVQLTEKTVKGGCWNKGKEFLQCRSRRGKWHKIGTVGIGFRIAWDSNWREGVNAEWIYA